MIHTFNNVQKCQLLYRTVIVSKRLPFMTRFCENSFSGILPNVCKLRMCSLGGLFAEASQTYFSKFAKLHNLLKDDMHGGWHSDIQVQIRLSENGDFLVKIHGQNNSKAGFKNVVEPLRSAAQNCMIGNSSC